MDDGFALIAQEVDCGKKGCKRCPHGPHWRVVCREGSKVVFSMPVLERAKKP